MALTKKKGTKATPKLPDINALKQVNSNDAGAFYNSLFSAQHKVEYANKDIALSNIRTNPFRRLPGVLHSSLQSAKVRKADS